MDYFDDVFYTFLDLDSVIYLAVKWDSHKPPDFHPKYLKLCSEDEQSFYSMFIVPNPLADIYSCFKHKKILCSELNVSWFRNV